jgi:hypothetical protein
VKEGHLPEKLKPDSETLLLRGVYNKGEPPELWWIGSKTTGYLSVQQNGVEVLVLSRTMAMHLSNILTEIFG